MCRKQAQRARGAGVTRVALYACEPKLRDLTKLNQDLAGGARAQVNASR
jgi:hypothetical protein